MDLIDKKLLCVLDSNCRKPVSQLARELRISRTVAAYRMNALENEGVIMKYICTVNLGALGYTTYKIYFKTHTHETEQKKFVAALIHAPAVIHCVKTEGSFDYAIALAVKTVQELDVFLTEIKTAFGELITDCVVNIVVYSNIFKFDKLLLQTKEQTFRSEKYAGESALVVLDDTDRKIIRVLSQESKLSILDIAKRTKLSVDVVKYRLKHFDKTLITSFRPLFNLNKLGYYHYVLLVRMRQPTKEDEKTLMSWCTIKPNALYCTKRIGHFDFEVNIAITDIADLNNFLADFKKTFGSVIDSYETIVNSELLKLNYVPF